MRRRRFLEFVTALAAAGGYARRSPGAAPYTAAGGPNGEPPGPPLASTVDAVKSVSLRPLGELTAEVAEHFQHHGRLWADASGWTRAQATDYTRYVQRMLKRPVTGRLSVDDAAALLSRPRCGVPDVPPGAESQESGRWKWTDLTYFVDPNFRSNLPVATWQSVLERAWRQWAEVSPIRGIASSGVQAADCTHASGSGSTAGFDGPGGVLAWAELPPSRAFAGRLLNRYDSGETWTAGTDAGAIRALNVACHEIGHLLGLGHSNDPSALMAPFYDPAVPAPVADDIRRIRARYPVAVPRDVGPVPPPPPPVDPPPGPVDPVDPGCPPESPPWGRPRFFPNRPRLFPRRRRIC